MLVTSLLLTLAAAALLEGGQGGQGGGVGFRRLQSTPSPTPAWLAELREVRSLLQCAQLCTSHFRCSCRGYQYIRSARSCRVSSSTLTEEPGAGSHDRSADTQYYTAASGELSAPAYPLYRLRWVVCPCPVSNL